MLTHLTASHRLALANRLAELWHGQDPLVLDFRQTQSIDGVGAALLAGFVRQAELANRPLQSVHLAAHLQPLLATIPYANATRAAPAPITESWLEAVGGAVHRVAGAMLRAATLTSELTYFALDAVLHRPRRVRGLTGRAVWQAMEELGARAVGVVALISFLVGLTVALQSAAQLAPYGASVFVVDLIGLTVCRELGPLLAAIVVAGRSGSACAAQIATMVVTEEVSALRAMGIEPAAYTVLPRLLAILVTQPMVSLCAQAAAIIGALCVSVLTLEISLPTFAMRLGSAVSARDLGAGAFKSAVFGALIVLVAARSGYAVTGGAEGVGQSTTRSVVTSIFCIIVADAIFSFLLYAW